VLLFIAVDAEVDAEELLLVLVVVVTADVVAGRAP
jgi:hypothetical protein